LYGSVDSGNKLITFFPVLSVLIHIIWSANTDRQMPTLVPKELIPLDDAERLQDLRAYQILYTAAEEAFDNLTQLMAEVFETPMVFMSLVDEDTVFYKSQVGKFGRDRADRSLSLCSISILSDKPTVFEDTQTESSLVNNTLVWSKGGIRFYAGAPLITNKGHRIGSVCVVDTRPRTFSAQKEKLLVRFAKVFMHEIEVRLAAIELVQSRESQKKLLQLVENSADLMAVLKLDGTPSYINRAGKQLLSVESDQTSALPLPFVPEPIQAQALQTGRWSGVIAVDQSQTDQPVPVHSQVVRIDDPATGKPLGLGAVMRDLRPELAAQRSLLSSEQRFRAIVEQAPLALGVLKGRDMVIDLGNERLFDVWGKDKSILGLPLIDALPEISDQPLLGLLEGVYDTGKPFFGKGVPTKLIRHGRLEDVYFDFTYTPLRDDSHDVTGVMVMASEVTLQVLAQQRIIDSQLQVLESFEQSPVGIATISEPDLTFRMANTFYGELVGRTPDQLVGKPLLDALPELAGQGFDQRLRDVLRTGEPFAANEVEVKLVRQQTLETVYVDLTYQPQREADKRITGVLVVATDVTQQVLTRRAIEASEAKLRSVIATAPAAMGLFVGRDLVVELPNQAFIEIVGKGPDITGKPLREIMPELEDQSLLHILDEVYTSGKMFQSYGSQVNIVQHGAMTHNFYNITYTPLIDSGGAVYAILGITIDVTAEVKARQEIQTAQESLQGAIELAELGTWQVNLTTGQTDYSDRLRSWCGIGKDEIITIDRAYHSVRKSDWALIKAAVVRATTPGSDGIYEVEFTLEAAHTGQERILHARGKAYFNDRGHAYLLRGSVQDVTPQRKMQLALEQLVQERTEALAATNEELAAINEEMAQVNQEQEAANQLLLRSNQNLEQFAYIASHDLQEPLRKIQSFSSLLRQQHADILGEKGNDILNRIEWAGARMSLLIRDLLTFSRISTRKAPQKSVMLSQVLEQVLDDLSVVIQESDAQIRVINLPTVQGDASQLGQLFQNLLSNALKFSRIDLAGQPVTPQITIRSTDVAASSLPSSLQPARPALVYYQIEVIDNGIGFEQKYTDRIFQVFQRLHGKNEFAGTGVGLAICQKVAVNHGGAITALSEPGKGAVFTVYLPA
jgi:PAS domain S-box-containing protein